jgi:hypothetical protein
VYLETSSLVEDGEIVALRKLRIEGNAYELRSFALAVMDAAEHGKTKVWVDETRVVIKRST